MMSNLLKLSDISSHQVVTVKTDDLLQDAVTRMAELRVSCLVVVVASQPVGIITERDVVTLMHKGFSGDTRVGDVMGTPLLTANPDLDFPAAQLLLSGRGVRHLVVVDGNGNLVGIVTESDFRRHLGRDFYQRIQQLDAVMDAEVGILGPDDTLAIALERMAASRLDHVVIASAGLPLGILTERDMPRLLARHINPATVLVKEVMSVPVLTVSVRTNIEAAAAQMADAHVRHMVVVDGSGHILGVVSQHSMLERLGLILMEEQRGKFQSRLDLVLAISGVGTWEYDYQASQCVCSASLYALLGYPADSGAIGNIQFWLQNIHPEDRPRVQAKFESARFLKENNIYAEDFRVKKADGQWLWVSTRGRVIERGANGQPLRGAGITIDISGQHQQGQEIKRLNAILTALVECSTDLIFIKDLANGYMFVNQAYAQFFGKSADDILGLNEFDLFPAEVAVQLQAMNRRIIAENVTQTYEQAIPMKGGGEAIFLITKGPLVADGQTLGVFGIARDITGRKQAEAERDAQLDELRRWHEVMLGRENRVLELKQEVNMLLTQQGLPPRYPSVESGEGNGNG